MKHFTLLIFMGVYLTGCATVSRGTKDKMVIDTEPTGAAIMTDKELPKSKAARKKKPALEAKYYGCPATPCEFKIPRRSEFIMTISRAGYEDVEIGVDYGLHKESLNANLAGSAATGLGLGLAAGAFVAGLAGTGGIAVSAAAASAGIATLGIGAVSIGVDAATGAMMNVRPNPVFITLPPKGTEFTPHPGAIALREKRQLKAEKMRNKSAPAQSKTRP